MSLSEHSITTATVNGDDEPPQKKQKRDEFACVACTDELSVDGDYLIPCRKCDKKYCYSCAQKVLETALQTPEQFPKQCCNNVWYPGLAEELLSADDSKRYKTKLEEGLATDPLYCPVPTCSEFIPRRLYKNGEVKIACPRCGSEACTLCKKPAVEGHDCNRNEHDEMLKKFDYKRCPRCNTAIAKLYGCEHMRCLCGAQFCWLCMRPISVCQEDDCNYDYDAENEPEPESTVEPTTDTELTSSGLLAAATTATATDEPAASDEDATNDGQAEPVNTQEHSEATGTADPAIDDAPPSRPSTEAETFVNLDSADLYNDRTDLNLNEEPGQDPYTMFDCHHTLKDFDLDNVSDKWLKRLNKSKGAKLMCMICFKMTFVSGKKKTIKGKEKVAEMYDCKHCGILTCLECKNAHELAAADSY